MSTIDSRENFVTLVEENLSDLIRVSFINGDRTLSHRFYQLTVSILRYLSFLLILFSDEAKFISALSCSLVIHRVSIL